MHLFFERKKRDESFFAMQSRFRRKKHDKKETQKLKEFEIKRKMLKLQTKTSKNKTPL